MLVLFKKRTSYFQLSISFLLFFMVFQTKIYSDTGKELLNTFLSTMNSFDSIRANININGMSGLMSFKKPNSIYLKLSDGRIISANGRHLWFYNPTNAIAGKQDLKGSSSGLYGLLSGYENISVNGRTLRLQSETKDYQEIIISLTSNNMLQSIRMKPQGSSNFIEISLSNIQTNIGLPSSLFNYHPPSNAQIVENPLNQKE